ncbi:MAG: Sporulation and spore germination [Acidimicrobiaceae bacterium]|nr:Sporulation and spore germination [Acidimicrobiaceae bacterium]
MRLRYLAGAIGGLALLIGGCGVPTSNSAKILQVPPALVLGSSTTTTLPGGVATVQVYFLRAGRLVQELVPVPAPATIAEALLVLGIGPTVSEANKGVTTGLPQTPQQATITYNETNKAGVATVTLDNTFIGMFGTRLIDALGQIVYTVTASGQAKKVVFQLNNQPYDAFLPDSTITYDPVGRVDYAAIAPLTTKA